MGSLNWASGLIPLGCLHLRPLQRHFHLLGLTNRFTPPCLRPFSPCHPSQAMVGPIISHVRNPYLTFPGGVQDFHGRLYRGLGRPHGGFPDSIQNTSSTQCAGAQGGNISPLKAMPHGSEKSPEKNRNEIRHSLCMPHGRVKIVANYEENDT